MVRRMDWKSLMGVSTGAAQGAARSAFQRDFDRVLFSRSFRRLVDKTQVFPMPDDDHVHTRLVHSLEVASVGRSLGRLVGEFVLRETGGDGLPDVGEFGDVTAAACLLHDIGNPPFGHAGEDAIAAHFRKREGKYEMSAHCGEELKEFEGNAQSFRIATKLERPFDPGGMRLNHATLGSFLKYPRLASGSRVWKKYGVFSSERRDLEDVAEKCGLISLGNDAWCRHPLAFLVEAADDICYRVIDIEDGTRLGKVPFEAAKQELSRAAALSDSYDAGRIDDYPQDKAAGRGETIAYLRGHAINGLIREAFETFKGRYDEILEGRLHMRPKPDEEKPEAGKEPTINDNAGHGEEIQRSEDERVSLLELNEKTSKILCGLENLAIVHCYGAPDVLEIELAGYRVLDELLSVFLDEEGGGSEKKFRKKIKALLPGRVRDAKGDERYRAVVDHVSGMTDRYAALVFRRLTGSRFRMK